METDIQSAQEAALAGNHERAVELLSESADVPAAIDTCIEAIRDLYWKEKNIKACVALGKAAISASLREAERSPSATTAWELRKDAIILSYNMSSFCWNGWNEGGLDLGSSERATGHELAFQHLDLITRFEPKPVVLAPAHWIVGAHLLTAREPAAALEHFQKSENFAKEARNEAERLLAQGYAALTRLLKKPAPADRAALDGIKQAFKTVAEGDEYIQQLETAEQVLTV